MNKRRAFTLIELMVVILILGILAALILPQVIGRQDQAKVGAAKRDLATLSDEISQFRLDCDRYPSTEEGLNSLMVQPNDAPGWHGPYSRKAIPNDPWGHPYVYQYPGPGGNDSFLLASYGKDGVEGGEGDNADLVDGQE